MDHFGGTESMVLGAILGLALFALVAWGLHRRWGWTTAIAVAGFFWWVLVIGLVTLVPLTAIDLAVPADSRSDTCSLDYGGPAPDGFWILSGTQRTLNTALFVPAGALLVLGAARWRSAWLLVEAGVIALVGYSAGIELAQLEVARIDRACDVTDVVDNVIGVFVGLAVGLVVALVLRPSRRRRAPH